MRTRDDVHADDFAAYGLNRLCTGIRRSLDGSNITGDAGAHKRATYLLHRAGQLYVGRLKHGISSFHQGDKAPRFY